MLKRVENRFHGRNESDGLGSQEYAKDSDSIQAEFSRDRAAVFLVNQDGISVNFQGESQSGLFARVEPFIRADWFGNPGGIANLKPRWGLECAKTRIHRNLPAKFA